MLPSLLLTMFVSGVIWTKINLDPLTKTDYFKTKHVGSQSQCALSCMMDGKCDGFGFLNSSCYYVTFTGQAASIGQMMLPFLYMMDAVEQNTNSTQQSLVNVTNLLSQGYHQYSNYFLKLYTTKKDWVNAETTCLNENSLLYSLNSITKRNILLQFLTDISYTSGGTFHIGLEKRADGIWVWPDNTTDVFYWSSTPPQQSEECGRFENAVGNVSTGQCGNQNDFLCEKSVAVS